MRSTVVLVDRGTFRGLLRGGVSLALVFFLASGVLMAQPSVWTDKADYSPGETVTIFGADFSAGASIDVVVIRPDGSIVMGDATFVCPGEASECWDTVAADAVGSFIYHYILDGIEGLYEVRAYSTPWSGNRSDVPLASRTFTDKATINLDQCANGKLGDPAIPCT